MTRIKMVLIGIVIGLLILMALGLKLSWDRVETTNRVLQETKTLIVHQDQKIKQLEQNVEHLNELQGQYKANRDTLNQRNVETLEMNKRPPMTAEERRERMLELNRRIGEKYMDMAEKNLEGSGY